MAGSVGGEQVRTPRKATEFTTFGDFEGQLGKLSCLRCRDPLVSGLECRPRLSLGRGHGAQAVSTPPLCRRMMSSGDPWGVHRHDGEFTQVHLRHTPSEGHS
jgi:hypothetical protein